MEYLACNQIFKFLNFTIKGISFCCNESRVSIPLFPIDENKFSLDEFLDFRLKIIEQFKSGQMPCPPDCEHLLVRDWPEDLTPLFGVIAMNNFTACNCDCYYCGVKNTGKSIYKPIDYLEEIHKRRYLDHDCIFSWGGGEISIYKGFKEELELSQRYKSKKVIHTSGILLSPLIANALKQNANVFISPDSGTKETYLKVKCVDKFEEVKNNIKIYSKCGGTITLKYIFNEYNCTVDDIKGFVELCKISPNISASASLTSQAISSKEYDVNQFLHLYWLIAMLNKENITVNLFTPFFLPDAIEKFTEFYTDEKYENLRNLISI